LSGTGRIGVVHMQILVTELLFLSYTGLMTSNLIININPDHIISF